MEGTSQIHTVAGGSRVERRKAQRKSLWPLPVTLGLLAFTGVCAGLFLVNLLGWQGALGLPPETGFRKVFLLALVAGLGAVFLPLRAPRLAGLALLAVAWTALLQPYHPFIVGLFEERVYSDRILYGSVAAALVLAAVVLRFPKVGFLLLVLALPFRLPVEIGGVTIHMMFLTYFLVWLSAVSYVWRNGEEGLTRDPLALPVLGLAALATLSSFWAFDYKEAILRTLYFYVSLPLAYVVVRHALSQGDGTLKLALGGAIGLGAALSGLAIFQFQTGYLFYNHPLQSAAFSARNVQLAEGWTLWNAQGLSQYKVVRESEGSEAGSRVQLIQSSGTAHAEIFQYVPVIPGQQYDFSAIARNSGAEALEIYGLFYQNKSKTSVHDTRQVALRVEGTSPWRIGMLGIIAPEDARYLQVSVKFTSSAPVAEAAVDDVRLSPIGSRANLLRGGDFERLQKPERPIVRVNGVFYDPNIFGRYLMLALLAVLALTFFGAGLLKRIGLVVTASLMISALFLTYSRSSLMALIVGLAILLYYRRDVKATLGAVVGLFAMAAFFWSELQMRMPVLSAAEDGSDVSGGRVELILTGISMWKDSLWYGHGLGSFSSLYSQFSSIKAPTDLSESHNFFITTLGELGILGGVAVLAVILMAAWLILRSGAGKQSSSRGLAAGLLAALVALIIHSSFQAYFFEDPFVWVVLGMAAAAYHALDRKKRSDLTTSPAL